MKATHPRCRSPRSSSTLDANGPPQLPTAGTFWAWVFRFVTRTAAFPGDPAPRRGAHVHQHHLDADVPRPALQLADLEEPRLDAPNEPGNGDLQGGVGLRAPRASGHVLGSADRRKRRRRAPATRWWSSRRSASSGASGRSSCCPSSRRRTPTPLARRRGGTGTRAGGRRWSWVAHPRCRPRGRPGRGDAVIVCGRVRRPPPDVLRARTLVRRPRGLRPGMRAAPRRPMAPRQRTAPSATRCAVM